MTTSVGIMTAYKQQSYKMTTITNEQIKEVYQMLKDRIIHPSGTFDAKKRFTAQNDDLINVRAPSARWPFSHMTACRSLKYVKAVCEKFECKDIDDLISKV